MAFNETEMLFETADMDYMNYSSDDGFDEVYDYDQEEDSLFESSYYKDEFDRLKTNMFIEETTTPVSSSLRCRYKTKGIPKVYNLPSLNSIKKKTEVDVIQPKENDVPTEEENVKVCDTIDSVDINSSHSDNSDMSCSNDDLISLSKLKNNEEEKPASNESNNLPIGSIGLSFVENVSEQGDWNMVDKRKKKPINEHTNKNKAQCVFFFRKGFCKFGNKCRFSHVY